MVSSKWNQQVITFTGSRIDGFHLDVLHENMKEPSSVVDSSPAESHPRYPEEMGPFSTTAGQLTDICSYPVVDKNLFLAVIFGHGQSLESVLLCSWRDIFSSHSGCLIQKTTSYRGITSKPRPFWCLSPHLHPTKCGSKRFSHGVWTSDLRWVWLMRIHTSDRCETKGAEVWSTDTWICFSIRNNAFPIRNLGEKMRSSCWCQKHQNNQRSNSKIATSTLWPSGKLTWRPWQSSGLEV